MHPDNEPTVEAIVTDNSAVHKAVCNDLNGVIAKAINSVDMFLDAAGEAQSDALQKLCIETKHRRDDFVLTLQKAVLGLGHDPATNENAAGWVHRMWTKGRMKLSADTDHAIAAELKKEEQSMDESISDALENPDMPADLRQMLTEERETSRRLHEFMAELKDSL